MKQRLLDVIPMGVREAETRRDLVFKAAGRVGAFSYTLFSSSLCFCVLEKTMKHFEASSSAIKARHDAASPDWWRRDREAITAMVQTMASGPAGVSLFRNYSSI